MSDHYFLNEDKTYRPCDVMTWAKQFDRLDKHVADAYVGDYRVSTIWLGLDHSFGGDKPLLFETMIFEKDDYNDLFCRRYTTWDEAEKGHWAAVTALKTFLDLP